MKSAKQFEVLKKLLTGIVDQGERRRGRLVAERSASGALAWWVLSPEGNKVLRVRNKVLIMFRLEFGWAAV